VGKTERSDKTKNRIRLQTIRGVFIVSWRRPLRRGRREEGHSARGFQKITTAFRVVHLRLAGKDARGLHLKKGGAA